MQHSGQVALARQNGGPDSYRDCFALIFFASFFIKKKNGKEKVFHL
jgi:hypothetical protein